MKKILTFICCAITCISYGQSGQLPPVYLPAGTDVCETTPWQLVFQDYFNDTKLDAPWITFYSWDGMPGPYGDNDNELWTESRCVKPYISIAVDSNIVVSNGTLKLQLKKGPISWHCDTCSTVYNKLYTSAVVALPYFVNGDRKSFNEGKFEASIKMPTFKNAHSNFWLWAGTGINEIDITEAYGQTLPGILEFLSFEGKNYPNTNYSLHAWKPNQFDITKPNPYGLANVEVKNAYPGQEWWRWVTGWGLFHQDQFHTYTLEWDTAQIKFFLDGNMVSWQWKYQRTSTYTKWWWPFRTYATTVGSGCNPTGTWNTMQGFPYNNTSESNLNLAVGIDHDDPSIPNGLVGQMEVDYVKVYQRYPGGWQTLCDPAVTELDGPDIICTTGTYTSSPPSPSGFWIPPVPPTLNMTYSNNAYCNVERNMAMPSGDGYVYYYALDPSCPNATDYFLQWKRMFVGTADNVSVNVVQTHNATDNTLYYNLHADPNYIAMPDPQYNYNSTNTYAWHIVVMDNGSPEYAEDVSGQYVSTPIGPYISGDYSTIDWTLTITNACGSVIQTGTQVYALQKPAPGGRLDPNTNNHYWAAEIPDYRVYEDAVDTRLLQTQFKADLDTTLISSQIEKIELEELAPYIILDSTMLGDTIATRKANNTTVSSSQTYLYPNPTNSYENFKPNGNYISGKPINIYVYDMMGKVQITKSVSYTAGDIINVDLTDLTPGIYNIKLRQEGYEEHFKIEKL